MKPLAERIRDVDYKRSAAQLSHADLCRRAGVNDRTWSKIRRGKWQPMTATIERLEAAVAGVPARKPKEVVKAFHRLVMIELCRQIRAPIARVLAEDLSVQRPSNKQWLQAARINRMAIYITAVELVLGNAELGRAIGCTRQNIKQARDDVEDWRERKSVDRVLRKVTMLVTGSERGGDL